MATRMQQRRGTQAQWTAANPVLAAGEIGFEIDNNRFKVGDGTNHWDDLNYFVDIESVLGGVSGVDLPAALDTLNEIANALNDDASLYNTLSNLINTGLEIGSNNLAAHKDDASNVHGVADMTVLTTETYVANAITTHVGVTSNVHGIANTLALATTTSVGTSISTALETAANNLSQAISDHNEDTSNVHGIANTNAIVYTTDSRLSDERTPSSSSVTAAKIASDAIETAKIANNAVTAAKLATDSVETAKIKDAAVTDAKLANNIAQSHISNLTTDLETNANNISGHTSANTNVHGITDTSKLVYSNAASITLDGSLTVTGNLIVNGDDVHISANSLVVEDPMIYLADGSTGNSVDLGLVGAFDNGTYQHTGLVRDASANTWKLFKGVTDEPATTVNFAQGSLDDLSVNDLTANGVVFSDGTQRKEGVPSRTPIIQKTDSYTLSATSERDSLIEVNKSSGSTITIPLNSAVAFPVGTTLDILQTGTGQVTIAGDSGVTVDATPGLKLRTRWSSATLFKRDTNVWVVFGDLSA
jgi:hypothetical protein